MTSQDLTIDTLVQSLIEAKKQEAQATAERVAFENLVIDYLGKREEGSETHTLESGLKVTITGKLSYTADMPLLAAICAALPEAARPLKTKVELDQTMAKKIRANDPSLWAMLSSAITMKPAKTAVEVKV